MSTVPMTEFERKLLETKLDTIQRIMGFRLPYDERRDQLYRHYVGRSYTNFYPDGKSPRSNSFVPYPYANVEQVRASLYEALFGIDPYFDCLPRGAKDEEAAPKMQKVMEQMVAAADLAGVIDEFLGGLCVYGLQPLKVDWDWDYDTVPVWQTQPVTDPVTGQPIPFPGTDIPQVQRVLVDTKVPRSRPKYTNIDIYDFAVDPDGACVAMMFDKTLPQMMREAEVNPKLYLPGALYEISKRIQERGVKDPNSLLIRITELHDAVDGTCTLLIAPEDLTSISYKNSRFANRSASYFGYRRETAEIPPMLLSMPYKPFYHRRTPILYTNYTKLPGEVFGMGVIEPTFNMIESLNRFVNMITDNWDLNVNRRHFVDNTRDLDWMELQQNNVPGGLIPVQGDPHGAVMPFETFTPDQGAYAILPMYQQMIETASGVTDTYDRGVGTGSGPGGKTASGIHSVLQQAGTRRQMLVRRISRDILVPALQMTASMIQQFCTDEMEVRITDEMPAIPKVNSQFLQLNPSDLVGNFDFRVVGAAYMEPPAIQQNNFLRALQIIGGLPEIAVWFKPETVARETLRIFRQPYPGRFMRTPEEVQAIQQQQMLAQLMMAQAEAQGKGEGGGGRVGPPRAPVSGQARQFAQSQGANAMGTDLPDGMAEAVNFG